MHELFDHLDYRAYIVYYLKALPNEGYGQLAKIARSISISPSTLTLIIQNQKDFTPDQANDFCEYLGMTEMEAEYFMLLVGLARASKSNYRARLQKQLQNLKLKSQQMKNRIPPERELENEASSVFYSQWYYSAIRICTSIDKFQTLDEICTRLRLSRTTVKTGLNFLIQTGLCTLKAGRYQVGPQSTHLGSENPLVSRHHQNWRLKGIEHSDRLSSSDFMFTSPVSIAVKDIPKVKKILMKAVEDCFQVIDPSSCEELVCLNIDWFKL